MAVGVQQADVNLAAEELLKAGDRPTVEKIRQRLGRGSPNTVAPLLNKWFETLPGRLKGEPADERGRVPLELAKPLMALLDAAVAQQTKALNAEREQLAEQKKTLELRQAELEALEAARAPLVEQLRAQLAQLGSDLAAARLATEARAQEVRAGLETTIENERARNSELASRLDQVSLAAAQEREVLERQRAAGEHSLREQHATAERRLLLQVDTARQEAKELAAERDATQRAHRQVVESSAATSARLAAELQEVRGAQRLLEGQLGERSERLQELQQLLESQQGQVQQLSAVNRQLLVQLNAKDRQLHALLPKGGLAKRRNRVSAVSP